MLTHVAGDDGIATGDAIDLSHQVLGLNFGGRNFGD